MRAQAIRALRVLVALALAAPAVAEEAEVSQANLGIAVMLLGSVGFMMGLFYLVNLEDRQLRKYSWQVISSTISIFSAVLLFQAVNGIVEEVFLGEDAPAVLRLGVSVVHMLVWFLFLQLALAHISGAIGAPPKGEEQLEQMELQLKCWAVLLGHITGFAAINAFSTFQQQVPRHWWATLFVAPLAWAVIFALGKITDAFRTHVALADDGEIDEAERAWHEETEETENDVIGLAVSFVIVQMLRFAISGELPNVEGEESEEAESSHSDLATFGLLVAGVAFAILEGIRIVFIKMQFKRFTPQLRNVVAMSFAWCLFFSSQWFLSAHFFRDTTGMTKALVLALFVTAVALGMIIILQKAEELDETDEDIDEVLRAIVLGLGILIGFAWERCFDIAVVSITSRVHFISPATSKLGMAVVLAAVVVPAWRMHILRTVMKLQKEDEEEEEDEEGGDEARAELDAAGALEVPLLGGAAGAEDARIEALLRQLQSRVAEQEQKATHTAALERRNVELESSLGGVRAELAELQKLADWIKTTN
eukprot:CAMPEP_0179037912 /NCGR_PEP_ID=MMETSP0796-20121207/14367_1 /TAXON_ID=73915 /ORGANISM="Pyrodinium bahamense, Strain pbaha01" /LENGTH=535 /DNA_ID=CAMNT_0020734223 /DNA_START=9 /DNA_END=1616 /DNA_ORIENTATION=+